MNTTDNVHPPSRTPLTSKVQSLVRELERIMQTHKTLNPDVLQKIISDLNEQVGDMDAIEAKMNSIRREIIAPVNSELQKMAKFGKLGLVVGLVGSIFAIISIIYTIYSNNLLNNSIASVKEHTDQTAAQQTRLLNDINQRAVPASLPTSDILKSLNTPPPASLGGKSSIPSLGGQVIFDPATGQWVPKQR
jgi:uncharacterized protein YoxC